MATIIPDITKLIGENTKIFKIFVTRGLTKKSHNSWGHWSEVA